jgi:DNA-binding MarR family transcriptional regulator
MPESSRSGRIPSRVALSRSLSGRRSGRWRVSRCRRDSQRDAPRATPCPPPPARGSSIRAYATTAAAPPTSRHWRALQPSDIVARHDARPGELQSAAGAPHGPASLSALERAASQGRGADARQAPASPSRSRTPEPSGPTVGEIADYLVVRHHSAVGLIDRAVADGLVKRNRDADSKSVVRITLTSVGTEKLDRLSEAHLDELAHLAPTMRALWRALDTAGDQGAETLAAKSWAVHDGRR